MTANGNEPLVALWAERNRLLALANVAGEKAKYCDDPHELEMAALDEKWFAIDERIANTVAQSLAGVVVQIKLHGDVLKDSGAWIHTAAWTRNVITALERMEGAAVDGM